MAWTRNDYRKNLVDYAVLDRMPKGIDFAQTWFCYMLEMDRQHFDGVQDFLDECGSAIGNDLPVI